MKPDSVHSMAPVADVQAALRPGMESRSQGHTPGPWMVNDCTVCALHGEPPRNRFSALVQSGRRDDAGDSEKRANARLMGAAPALLEALQNILGVEVCSPEGGREEVQEIHSIARAAIALATGQSDSVGDGQTARSSTDSLNGES